MPMLCSGCRYARRGLLSLALAAIAAVMPASFGASPPTHARPAFDLPVCVTANDLPSSARNADGYEQRVAKVLGKELHATVQFVWTPSGRYAVRHQLAQGVCDVVMGAPEGAKGVLNTVPYFRSPFVFLYRKDSGYTIHGLRDPRLKKLRIAVQSRGLAYTALSDAGLSSRIVHINANYSVAGAATIRPLVQAVEAGRVDAALVYGPDASVYARQAKSGLRMTQVHPVITSGGYSMFYTETLGVRPGDASLRRDLDNAFAAGWKRVQQAITASGVPTLSVAKPVASNPPSKKPLQVGVVLPIPSAFPAATDHGARAAEAGATLADRLVGGALRSRDLRVRFASSPNRAAAARAARRLVLVDHVSALVGGMGTGQAAAIARVADAYGVPFLNVADASDSLRSRARADVFHVAASRSMYIDALARWSLASKRGRWFVVAQGPGAKASVRQARRALAKAGGGAVVGDVELPAGASSYYRVFDRIAAAAPDLVVLAMSPPQQELFLGQLPAKNAGMVVTGVLPTYAQDRHTFAQMAHDTTNPITDFRPVMWDAAEATKAAKSLDQEYGAQFGMAIDAGAWSTYVAIEIVADASRATGTVDPKAIASYLSDPSHTFQLAKGVPLSFRSRDHQLRQPLYIAKLDPKAPWGANPSAQTALASVVATVPLRPASQATPAGR